ncbi:MAG: guanylate kinase [Candidatus Pacebacteria bacterium]|nr:guanylate kinase [Candidatus Paceibacterota bacterium]
MGNYELFLLVGPSGVGKDSVLRGVIKSLGEIKTFPSFTTRLPRMREKNGREYFFVTEKEFHKLIDREELLEWEEVHPGLLYGTPRKVENLLKKSNLIKSIDILGAKTLKKIFKDKSVIVFIKPPNERELKNRIKKRGGLSDQQIKERFSRIDFEIKNAKISDYQVINDKLKECVREVKNIILKEILKQKTS